MSNIAAHSTSVFPRGFIPAVHTPFHSNGDLNLEAVARQASSCRARNLPAVFVAGTTGECHSLAVDERQQLVQRWCEVTRGTDVRVMVHVGSNCQRDACQLAKHAADCGVAAIAAIPPFYFKPQSLNDLIEFLAPIAESAPGVPFYYYDIPSFTGVSLDMARLLQEGRKRIDNLAGLKFSNHDLLLMQRCIQTQDGAFEVLHGLDETLLAGLTMGVHGAVGNTYNIAAGLYQQLLHHWVAGAGLEARRLQAKSVRLIHTLQAFGFQAAAKAALELVDLDCGPPRPPLRPLEPAAKKQLLQQLKELEVLDAPTR